MTFRSYRAGLLLAIAVFIGAVVALFLALRFADSEVERDQLVWQQQMNVVLNSRQAAVSAWLTAEKKIIRRLAENPSLQIYLNTVIAARKEPESISETALAQAGYLENQLKALALQQGYGPTTDAGFVAQATTDQNVVSGLALTDPRGRVIVATPHMPSVAVAMAAYHEQKQDHEQKKDLADVMIFGPYKAEDGAVNLSFMAPIFGVQDGESDPAIGFVVGVKALSGDFYNTLIQPGEISKSARNYLVRQQDSMVAYLSPLTQQNGDVISPLSFALDGTGNTLAARFVLDHVTATRGGFAERLNFQGQKVLVTGRQIVGTDWTLVRSVESAEVMGAIMARKRMIVWIAGLVILALSITILLIWRHGVSVRLARAAEVQQALTEKYEKLSHFLQVVTDSQPTVITAVDHQNRYIFANAPALCDSGLDASSLTGQTIDNVPGILKPADSAAYCRKVLADQEALSVVEKLPSSGHTVKADYVPLSLARDDGVLMVVEDISDLVRQRELRETALKNLVSTLTMVIDSRDPYSARHSERVAIVARAIAVEMGVDETNRDTASIAGALMNLGKILVPREFLTRPKELTEEELLTIRSSILKTADMLEEVEFDGPVVESLRQIRAHWDGSGHPAGLAGEAILLPARIVAVANAFVGMTSARAHRAGMALDKAALLLLNEADRIYDRKPVAALLNFLENKGGMAEWKDFPAPLPET